MEKQFVCIVSRDSPAVPQSARRNLHVSKTSHWVREIAETIVLILVIFFVVRLAVQNFKVQGTSMLPTIQNGSLVLVNKVDYLIHQPQAGDVVVFKAPPEPSQDFIKRVIATPGESVQVHSGKVFVDGHALKEPYELQTPNYTMLKIPDTNSDVVPKNDVFVLGDNRRNSYDSHLWGLLPQKNIIGKALVSYWPPSDLKFFSFVVSPRLP